MEKEINKHPPNKAGHISKIPKCVASIVASGPTHTNGIVKSYMRPTNMTFEIANRHIRFVLKKSHALDPDHISGLHPHPDLQNLGTKICVFTATRTKLATKANPAGSPAKIHFTASSPWKAFLQNCCSIVSTSRISSRWSILSFKEPFP